MGPLLRVGTEQCSEVIVAFCRLFLEISRVELERLGRMEGGLGLRPGNHLTVAGKMIRETEADPVTVVDDVPRRIEGELAHFGPCGRGARFRGSCCLSLPFFANAQGRAGTVGRKGERFKPDAWDIPYHNPENNTKKVRGKGGRVTRAERPTLNIPGALNGTFLKDVSGKQERQEGFFLLSCLPEHFLFGRPDG
jgi:hypothetical protein